MRSRRILGDGPCSYYHVLSRVIERRFILEEQEQEHFRKLMRAQEAFSGVRVLTWTCMSNHFHMLVAVEDRESEEVQAELALLLADDAAFLARMKLVYSADALDGIEKMLKVLRSEVVASEVVASEVVASEVVASEVVASEVVASEVVASEVVASVVVASVESKKLERMSPLSVAAAEYAIKNEDDGSESIVLDEDVFATDCPGMTREEEVARFKQPFLDRLYDLSAFVGEVKQRFSQWYNKRNERLGPLWEDRFKSVLVQGDPGVLATVAAYIDLNSVRAGVVKDPREWRWCGYAEALKGQGVARSGVYESLGMADATRRDGGEWRKVHRRYRQLLMEEGRQLRDEDGRVVRKGLTAEEFETEEARDFELPAPALLRYRIGYFVDGLALGSAAFVESVFEKNRGRMGVKRTNDGARVPRQALGDLRTLRDLRGCK
ncbi:MAG: hypothetical protein ACI9R3_004196 [Verrucomicrobiales bacterium]|jgi:hypothetical protein